MRMKTAQILMECLLEQGVDTVFGYPGGTILNVYDEFELHGYKDKIRHILTAHEQGASHAADGYARATGKVGVCFATSGPGATNLTTGIATAYYDSSPVVFITCNVSENLIGKDSFQEVDITGISMPITKCNYLVKDPGALADVLREAFAIARSGRPGPVLVDIAKNVTAAEADYEPLPLDQHANHGRLGAMLRRASHDLKTPEPDAGDIQTLLDLIEGARKPLVLVGGGVIRSKGAVPQFRTFIERLNAPVASTIRHDRYARLPRLQSRLRPVRSAHRRRLPLLRPGGHRPRHLRTQRQNRPHRHRPGGDRQERAHPPPHHRRRPPGAGAAQRKAPPARLPGVEGVGVLPPGGAPQERRCSPPPRDSGDHPGRHRRGCHRAVGNPGKVVVHCTGDGCFRMNCHELCTAEHYNIPVITVIFNNRTLGMVRQWQNLIYQKRFSQTDLDRGPDFVKLAEAYGIQGERAATQPEFEAAFRRAVAAGRPYLIECAIDKDAMVHPMVSAGAPVTDFILD